MEQIKIEESWKKELSEVFQKPFMAEIKSFILNQKQNGKQIFPPSSQIFRAFDATPIEKVKVVIIGQDPYHGDGQAHGLCFSVEKGIKPPPSLKNIFKELERDIDGFVAPQNGNLEKWASQGVFLLNAILTVNKNEPASHQNAGWEKFTDEVIRKISDHREHVVFMLWGNFAQQKKELIDSSKHLILKSTHPSPFSAHRGFLGCGHFSKANGYLKSNGADEIDWKL